MALINKLKSIADAIREKTGKTDGLTLDAMPEEIRNIKTAKEPYVEETYDENGYLLSFKLVGNYNRIRAYMFAYQSKLNIKEMPEGIRYIESGAFQNCDSLTMEKLNGVIEVINSYAFYNCYGVKISRIPASVTSIYNETFGMCTGLTELTFEGTPALIHQTAFSGCTNLTVINVPWSEGAVANAPWGAENATINYDYTGD